MVRLDTRNSLSLKLFDENQMFSYHFFGFLLEFFYFFVCFIGFFVVHETRHSEFLISVSNAQIHPNGWVRLPFCS